MADPQIGPDPSAGSSPAFIRARLALASSYVKKRLIRSSHIKQKKNRIAAILSLAGGAKSRLVLRWGREAKVRYRKAAVVRREFLLACHAFTRDFCL